MGGGASHSATLTEENVMEDVFILKSGNAANHHTTLLPLVAAAGNQANSYLLCDPSFEFVPSLLSVLCNDTGFMRTSALLIFQNLSCFDPHRAYLCSDEVGLVEALLNIVKNNIDQSIVTGSCRILHNLVAPTTEGVNPTCELLANNEHFFPILIARLKEMKHVEISKSILGILRCFFKLCYISQLCLKYHLIPLLTELMTTDCLQAAVVMLRLISIYGDERISDELLSAALPTVGLLVLAEAGTDTSKWLVSRSVAEWLVFLLYAARFPAVATVLRENKGIEVFTPLSTLPPCEGSVSLKASILLAFLCGRDEAVRGQVSVVNDTIINLLIDALSCSLEGDAFGSDAAGVFRLPLLLSAFNTMIISDSNKRAFAANQRIVPLLKKVLRNVMESLPSVDAMYGGGMHDSEYEALALNTILNLAFVDDDVVNDSNKLFNRASGMLEIVTAVSHKEGLCEEAKHSARLLISKLNPSLPEAVPLASPRGRPTSQPIITHSPNNNNTSLTPLSLNTPSHTSSHTVTVGSSGPFPSRDIVPTSPATLNGSAVINNSGSHIMISYCYTQRRHAAKLANELRTLGYDVWRDEEGSHLVPRMNGAFDDDTLAKAVESASHFVICVSRSYKESQFCRMEANYANQLSRTDRLQIHYVMLESDYTPVSVGTSCNGWLGLMIGDEHWLPGFHDAAICASALKLAGTFGRSAYVGNSNSSSGVGSGGVNYSVAYAVLTDEEATDAPKEVESYLRRLGVKCAQDLEYLESDNVSDLAAMLKLVGRKKFLQAMNVNINSNNASISEPHHK